MTLCPALDAAKITAPDVHPIFPDKVQPPHFKEFARCECRACPQGGAKPEDAKPGHETYHHGFVTEALPAGMRPAPATFRALQYLASRAASDAAPMYASESGFLPNGIASLNFADSLGWNVVSVSGSTVVVETPDASDPGARGIYSFRVANESGIGFSTIGVGGPPQPGDQLIFDYPSALWKKVVARITKVVLDRDAHRATFTLDKSVASARVDCRANVTPTTSFTCKTWRQAGDPEQWRPIPAEPSAMRCNEKRVVIAVADIPEADGLVELLSRAGASCRIAWPREAGTDGDAIRPSTFTVEQITTDSAEWADVTGTWVGRLQIRPTGAGADGFGAWKTTLCLGTKNADGSDHAGWSGPGETVTHLRVTYWPEAAAGAAKWCSPCSNRCHWSVRDFSAGDPDADDGSALAGSERWICSRRRWFELQNNGDELGTWRAKYFQPSGIDLYQPHCSLYGVCDQFAPMDTAARGRAGFSLWRDASEILRQINHSANIRLNYRYLQPQPDVQRLGNPSILSLLGGPALGYTAGLHDNYAFPAYGLGFVGDFATTTDDGNVLFTPLAGAHLDSRTNYSDVEVDTPGTYPGPGILPSQVPDWEIQFDAFGVEVDDTADPREGIRRHESRAGYSLTREGEHSGRQLSRMTETVQGDFLVLPKFDFAEIADVDNPWQDRGEAKLKVFSTNQTGPGGYVFRALLQIRRLDANTKTPVGVVASGKVARCVSGGTGLVVIDLYNVVQSATRIVADEELTYSWAAGGKFVRPEHWMTVPSSAQTDNTVGGCTDRAAVGDSLAFPVYTFDGHDDFTAYRFPIVAVEAHGGTSAPDWVDGNPGTLETPGDLALIPEYSSGAAWGKRRDRITVRDERGLLTTDPSRYVTATVNAVRGEAVLDPASPLAVAWTPFQSDDYTALTEATAGVGGDYLVDYGRGMVWFAPAAVAAMVAAGNTCLRLGTAP